MKTKWKVILGAIGLILFATLVTVLIIKKDSKKTDGVVNETVDEIVNITTSEEQATATWDEDEWQPEGADSYAVDDEPLYNVYVKGMEVLNECKECPPAVDFQYYLETYLNLCTGNLDEMYTVELQKGTYNPNASSEVFTVEATVDKYPDVTLLIEYNKVYNVFGISSSLGDYSLAALEEKAQNEKPVIEYDPSLNDSIPEGAAPATAYIE